MILRHRRVKPDETGAPIRTWRLRLRITTCAVAKKLGRRSIGLDIDPHFCAVPTARGTGPEYKKALEKSNRCDQAWGNAGLSNPCPGPRSDPRRERNALRGFRARQRTPPIRHSRDRKHAPYPDTGAGIHAITFRERTSTAIPPPTSTRRPHFVCPAKAHPEPRYGAGIQRGVGGANFHTLVCRQQPA